VRSGLATGRASSEVSTFDIAKIAGTSTEQIEKTYAHLLKGHADRWRTALDKYDAQKPSGVVVGTR
jgi:hypothetical protein